jgi:hypothetical protein
MAKTRTDRKVNRKVKQFNKELREDVFKGRFEVRQLEKTRVDGMQYYLYEVRDNHHPERNRIVPWEWGDSVFFMNKIWMEMNDLIITSDFWDLYWAERRAVEDLNKMADTIAQGGKSAEELMQSISLESQE